MKFLDDIGLSHLIIKLKEMFNSKVDKVSGKQLSTEDYSTNEKNKLIGIEIGANKYKHPDTHPYDMITGTPTSLPADGGNADTVNGKTVLSNVPADAIFTDTTDHTHTNISTLNKFTEVDNKPFYNGEEIGGGASADGGQSTFAGNSTERIIPHGLQLMPTSAGAFPMEDTKGFMGEIWVRFDATNLYVGNTGSYTGAMSWIVVPNVEE